MSTTPQDFEPPLFVEEEDTKTIVLKRLSKLERIEERRTGSLTVINWLLGVLLSFVVIGCGWLVTTLNDVKSDVHSLAAEVHARFDAQQRDIDQLERRREND